MVLFYEWEAVDVNVQKFCSYLKGNKKKNRDVTLYVRNETVAEWQSHRIIQQGRIRYSNDAF